MICICFIHLINYYYYSFCISVNICINHPQPSTRRSVFAGARRTRASAVSASNESAMRFTCTISSHCSYHIACGEVSGTAGGHARTNISFAHICSAHPYTVYHVLPQPTRQTGHGDRYDWRRVLRPVHTGGAVCVCSGSNQPYRVDSSLCTSAWRNGMCVCVVQRARNESEICAAHLHTHIPTLICHDDFRWW